MKEKIKKILEWGIAILVILAGCSWLIGYKVDVDENEEMHCYNFWDKEVRCR